MKLLKITILPTEDSEVYNHLSEWTERVNNSSECAISQEIQDNGDSVDINITIKE